MNNKTGCLMWVIFSCFLILWGWKLVDFYILQPAMVKKALNDTMDGISSTQHTSAKQVQFNANWAEYERTSDIRFEFSGFRGDSFTVQWQDTLHIPVFPSISHTFRFQKLVR